MWSMSRAPFTSNEPTWVYEIFCAHGGLLYVGITNNLDRRIAQHRSKQSWWNEVEEILATQFPTRTDARRMELAVILHKQPVYNREGVNENDQHRADPLAGRRVGLPSRAVYPKESL